MSYDSKKPETQDMLVWPAEKAHVYTTSFSQYVFAGRRLVGRIEHLANVTCGGDNLMGPTTASGLDLTQVQYRDSVDGAFRCGGVVGRESLDIGKRKGCPAFK